MMLFPGIVQTYMDKVNEKTEQIISCSTTMAQKMLST